MRVLVFGGRDYMDKDYVYSILDLLYTENVTLEIISGMARGADTWAAEWAKDRGVKLHSFPAQWKKYPRNSAGPIRNQQMIDEGHPNMAVRFPGGTGTADMAKRLAKAHIRPLDFSDQPQSDLNPYPPRRLEAPPLTIESFL